jgi:pyruvate/2-oxoglutarate dehydrogenase complex dihydrolipoamide dehydrogenase (E3) component
LIAGAQKLRIHGGVLDAVWIPHNQSGKPDSDLAKTGIKVSRMERRRKPVLLQTTAPAVFAGGDLVTGPWTVSDAMGHGKKFAQVIDTQLMGKNRFPELKKAFSYSMEVALEPEGGNRNEAAEVHFQKYRGNFQEVSTTHWTNKANERCLR